MIHEKINRLKYMLLGQSHLLPNMKIFGLLFFCSLGKIYAADNAEEVNAGLLVCEKLKPYEVAIGANTINEKIKEDSAMHNEIDADNTASSSPTFLCIMRNQVSRPINFFARLYSGDISINDIVNTLVSSCTWTNVKHITVSGACILFNGCSFTLEEFIAVMRAYKTITIVGVGQEWRNSYNFNTGRSELQLHYGTDRTSMVFDSNLYYPWGDSRRLQLPRLNVPDWPEDSNPNEAHSPSN